MSSIKRKVNKILKLLNLTNVEGFFDIVGQCKGNVYLVSPEGDKFNLKSTLCRFVAFSKLLSQACIEGLELECENTDDAKLFIDFMVRGDY